MKLSRITPRRLVVLLSAAVLTACGGGGDSAPPAGGGMTSYAATSLVSDFSASTNPYNSANVDANLVNAWGLAFNPNGFAWVANAGTSTSTLYDGNGMPQTLVVAIPAGTAGAANPTGIVYNGGTNFVVTQAGVSGASPFIFVGEAGTLSGWSPNVSPNAAITVYDGAASGTVYKGLAIASSGGTDFLYATEFHNGHVDVFDATFTKIAVAGDVVVRVGVLHRVAHVDAAADRLDAERRVACRQVGVGERAGHRDRREVRVVDVDHAIVEVGGVQARRRALRRDR